MDCFVRVANVFFIYFLISQSVEGDRSPCGDLDPLLHGSVTYFRNGRLAQYFCSSGYQVYGNRRLSCVGEVWKGQIPKCVSNACITPIPPLHSDRKPKLRGAVIEYSCRDGYELHGSTEIYCDGSQWSSLPPECRSVRTPVSTETRRVPLKSIPTLSPNSAISEYENSSVASDSESKTPEHSNSRKPIYIDRSEKPPSFTESRFTGNNGVLSLYKTTSDDEDTEGQSTESELPPRVREMPPAIVESQSANSRRGPVVPAILQFQYQNYRQRSHEIMAPQYRWDPRYGVYPLPRSPYSQFGPHSVFPNPYYANPIPPTRLRYSNIGSQIGNRDESPDAQKLIGTDARSESGFRGNVADPGYRIVDRRLPEVVTSYQPSTVQPTRNTPMASRTPTLTSVSLRKGDHLGCPQARRPIRGFFATRGLPRDYEGEDYLYLVEYQCFRGLTLVGDNIRYCKKDGRWSGTLPRCERVVECGAGYVRKAGGCVDLNECANGNGGCPHKCLNYDGGYRCSCHSGYRLQQDRSCSDVDECEGDVCDHECHNTPGSFKCTCQEGYTVSSTDSTKCIDKDECLVSSPCEHLCQNTIGSYRCACRRKFRLGDDGRSCVEVCLPGYAMKGGNETDRKACVDEDECEEHGGLGNCQQVCNNTAGSFFCSCVAGFKLNEDGQTCSDLDECAELKPCQYGCENRIGTYSCSCPPNQIQSPDRLSCIGCRLNFYMNNGSCIGCPTNSRNRRIGATSVNECLCFPGYRGSPELGMPCTDIDECEDDNYGCSHRCVNTLGSVFCECPSGYTLSLDGRTCTDEDECYTQSIDCGPGGICQNTPGGYNCTCLRGFRPDVRSSKRCVDVDECSFRNGGCQSRCTNMQPGYRCSCYSGKKLGRDGKSCVQIGPTCPALKTPQNGRILPSYPCTAVEYATEGRLCFFVCNSGHRISAKSRLVCQSGRWSSKPPVCINYQVCQPLEVPEGVRVVPPTCSTNTSSFWRMCVFSCQDPTDIMKGSRTTKCLPQRRWEHEPPRCVSKNSALHGSSTIPRINCPPDIDLTLARGQSLAVLRIRPPITNMAIVELTRGDGELSKYVYHAGTTTVNFTAYTSDRMLNASCSVRVHVRDREAPTIERCPGTIDIESTHEFPERAWKHPIFRDNVRVVSVKESRLPAGNITWGTYSVSYTASDAAGNMAECAFTVIIRRPKMSRAQGMQVCGTPTGPQNGDSNCQSWAFGIYCVPICDAGFAFAQIPPTYVCDEDGIWTPGRAIPDCVDMRPTHDEVDRSTTTTRVSATTPKISLVPTPETTLPSTTTGSINREDFASQGSTASVRPTLRILERPTFLKMEIRQQNRDPVFRKPPYVLPEVRKTVVNRVSQPRLIKLLPETTDCPSGQVPEIDDGGMMHCVECPKGHYRPRIANAVRCLKCSPGFYQDAIGKGYCNRCPNVTVSLNAIRSIQTLRGLTSPELCRRIDDFLGRNTRVAAKRILPERRSLHRTRHG